MYHEIYLSYRGFSCNCPIKNLCYSQTSHCSEFLKQPACSHESDVFWGLSEASPDDFSITFWAFSQLHQFTWKCIFYKQFLPLKWKTDSNSPLTEFFILNKPFLNMNFNIMNDSFFLFDLFLYLIKILRMRFVEIGIFSLSIKNTKTR